MSNNSCVLHDFYKDENNLSLSAASCSLLFFIFFVEQVVNSSSLLQIFNELQDDVVGWWLDWFAMLSCSSTASVLMNYCWVECWSLWFNNNGRVMMVIVLNICFNNNGVLLWLSSLRQPQKLISFFVYIAIWKYSRW